MNVELEDVTVRYGSRVALSGITLNFEEGKLISLLGANGSGKSTLLRVIARILEPASGVVRFGGRDLSEWDRKEFARTVSYLQQDPSTVFPIRAVDLVLSGRSPFLGRFQWETALDLQLAREALVQCDALDLEDRFLHTLSGGERKRVFLARVIVSRPSVVLLDEPLSGLDVAHIESFMQLLRSLVDKQGMMAIFISHEFNWCSAYSDRMIVLQRGSVAVDGLPEKVMTASSMRDFFGFSAETLESSGGRWIVPKAASGFHRPQK